MKFCIKIWDVIESKIEVFYKKTLQILTICYKVFCFAILLNVSFWEFISST